MKPGPFIKWAGGKTKLLSTFEALFPRRVRGYIEPFVGGGAVLFHILRTRKPNSVLASDFNLNLVRTYRAVRDLPIELCVLLGEHKELNSEKHYYLVRKRSPQTKLKVASRFIYLNKTCFNGLHRENKKGEFNVPWGRYSDPEIFKPKAIRAASKALRDVVFLQGDFRDILKKAKKGDFIYLDPPYDATFTSYTSKGFGEEDQRDLALWFRRLDRRGCKVMLSNSDTKLIRKLYKGYDFTVVSSTRTISSNGAQRVKTPEVVVRNYGGRK